MKSLKSWDIAIIGIPRCWTHHMQGHGELVAWYYIYRLRTVPVAVKCKRVHSHMHSTAMNGSTDWPWSGVIINKVRGWEAKVLRLTFRLRMRPAETWVGYRTRTAKKKKRNSWRNMGLPLLIDKILEQHLDYYDVGRVPRRCPNYAGSSCHFEGVERLLGGEAVPLGVWRGIPTTCKGESTKLGSTTEGYSGTHRWRDGLARGMIG